MSAMACGVNSGSVVDGQDSLGLQVGALKGPVPRGRWAAGRHHQAKQQAGQWVPGMGPPPKGSGVREQGLVTGWAAEHRTAKTRASLEPGFRVARISSSQEGDVEFVPAQGPQEGEVLVNFLPSSEDLSALTWVARRDLRILDATCGRLVERADVRAYREALRVIEMGSQGVSVAETARQLGRPEEWVRKKMAFGDSAKLQKPRGMEWWDPKGFCEVTYLRRYAHQQGLYEEIVQGVNWEQDKVWRVRKQDGSDDWHLRTVKECPGRPGRGFCGRSLQKVPDSTHQIGPQDRRHAATTRPHGDWACALGSHKDCGCQKPELESPMVEPYWWCPACRWYGCDLCVKQMGDKATSKQVAHWRPGECPRLDALVADVVRDFSLPDPHRTQYTVKMNWYPDALSRVSPHRHDNWTLLLSLGAPRVLTVDRARVLMEDGDIVLFGTQSHGVPEMPSCQGGRLSLVFMFAPDALIGAAATARAAAAGGPGGRREAVKAPDPHARFQSREAWLEEEADEGEIECDAAAGEDGSLLNALCALGFRRSEASVALAAAAGDVEMAATILLAAA